MFAKVMIRKNILWLKLRMLFFRYARIVFKTIFILNRLKKQNLEKFCMKTTQLHKGTWTRINY